MFHNQLSYPNFKKVVETDIRWTNPIETGSRLLKFLYKPIQTADQMVSLRAIVKDAVDRLCLFCRRNRGCNRVQPLPTESLLDVFKCCSGTDIAAIEHVTRRWRDIVCRYGNELPIKRNPFERGRIQLRLREKEQRKSKLKQFLCCLFFACCVFVYIALLTLATFCVRDALYLIPPVIISFVCVPFSFALMLLFDEQSEKTKRIPNLLILAVSLLLAIVIACGYLNGSADAIELFPSSIEITCIEFGVPICVSSLYIAFLQEIQLLHCLFAIAFPLYLVCASITAIMTAIVFMLSLPIYGTRLVLYHMPMLHFYDRFGGFSRIRLCYTFLHCVCTLGMPLLAAIYILLFATHPFTCFAFHNLFGLAIFHANRILLHNIPHTHSLRHIYRNDWLLKLILPMIYQY